MVDYKMEIGELIHIDTPTGKHTLQWSSISGTLTGSLTLT